MDTPRDPDLAARLFGATPERRLVLLRAAWPVAVGPELARRTEVVALDRGVLRVRVPDAAWQRNLFRMRGTLLGRLRRIAGGAAPHALGFVQGSVIAPAATPEPPPAPAPERPLPASITDAAQAIDDEELRELFLRSAGRYLSRFARR